MTQLTFNLADLYESLADVIGERDALVCGDRRLTYQGLEERANRLASFLRARGIGPGDHIGLYLYNGAEYLEAMLAAFKLRAVPININYRYVAEELRYLCENSDLVGIIHQASLADPVTEVLPRIRPLRTRLSVADGPALAAGAIDYEAAMAQGSPARDFGPRSGDDLYVIYTGGTTGMPRGVMWRHEDVFFAGLQGGRPGGDPILKPEELAPLVQEGPGLVMLPAAPFIHGAAQWAGWIGLFTGGKVVSAPAVVVPGASVFDVDFLSSSLQAASVSAVAAALVPTMNCRRLTELFGIQIFLACSAIRPPPWSSTTGPRSLRGQ